MKLKNLDRGNKITKEIEGLESKIRRSERMLGKDDMQAWRDENDYTFTVPLGFIRAGIIEYVNSLKVKIESLTAEFNSL